MKQPVEKSRLKEVDFLKAISILGVILIHTTSQSLEQGSLDVLRFPLTFFLNQVARFAVPLFFLLSGYVLEYHSKDPLNILEFYKKRLKKILTPYLVWCILYYLLYYQNPVDSIFHLGFIKGLIVGNISIQMYFVPALVLLYGLFPIFHKYQSFIQKKPVFVIFTVVTILVLFIDYYFGLKFLPEPIRIALLNSYLFVVGMLISKIPTKFQNYIKNHRFMLVSLLLLSFFGMVYESRDMYLWTKNINNITSQWRVTTYVYMLTFSSLLITLVVPKLNRFQPFYKFLSRVSFFIFFIHIFFISLYWRIIGSYLFSRSLGNVISTWWFDLSVFIFVASLSLGTSLVVIRIPKLAKLLGI